MEPTLDEYWGAIKEKVCKHCIDETDGAGNLLERENEDCALRRFFPEIVKMVKSIKSDDIDDYVLALRVLICSHARINWKMQHANFGNSWIAV